MNKYKDYLVEFSNIYKRLMELEICLKYKIFHSIITNYPDNCYELFKPFFIKEKTSKKYYDYKKKVNELIEIYKNTTFTEQDKLKESLDLLYLSDALKFLVEVKTYYKDPKLIQMLYVSQPQNFNHTKENKGKLCDLRNNIAHYNFKDYEKKRKEYTRALVYFEIHIGCSYKKLHELPKLNYKPSINEILKAVYQLEPSLFNKDESSNNTQANQDRRLCELCDDLAIINGWNYNELKSHWSILRNKYYFKNKLKAKLVICSIKQGFKKIETKVQLPLFTSPNS